MNVVDVAECIDDNFNFVEGLHIHLMKGCLVLSNNVAQMVNSNKLKSKLEW